MKKGKIVAISVSRKKGEKKQNVKEAILLKELGLKGDAHGDGGLRQVSLLMDESIQRMRSMGLKVNYGDFAENIVTRGIDLTSLNVNDRIRIGREGELEVTQIGKDCKTPCRIYYEVGSCIMPSEGIFCRVVEPGRIAVGDSIYIPEEKNHQKIDCT
jgi:MOSC domain-containing protein YiiM